FGSICKYRPCFGQPRRPSWNHIPLRDLRPGHVVELAELARRQNLKTLRRNTLLISILRRVVEMAISTDSAICARFGPVVCRKGAGLGRLTSPRGTPPRPRSNLPRRRQRPSRPAAAYRPRDSIGPSYEEPPRSEDGGASLRPAGEHTGARNA